MKTPWAVNVYREESLDEAIEVTLKNCTVESTKDNKAVLNIKNANQAVSVTLEGENKVLIGNVETADRLYQVENAAPTATDGKSVTVVAVKADGTTEIVFEAKPIVTGVTVSGIAGFEGRSFGSFAEAYAEIKSTVENLGLGQEVATTEQFDALFTSVDANGNATLTYTISGTVVYDETDCANLLTMGRKASHYGNGRHLINFKFVGKTGKDTDTLTVNSDITLPYEWWGEKTTTGIHFENLTITGSAPNGLYPHQSFFEGIDFSVANCTLKGLKIYNCSNVPGSYSITDSVLDGTGAPANSYAIHLQGNETAPLAITISGNTITGYDRGINIDQKTAVATISGNTISVNDAGRSCIQLSRLATAAIVGNTLELTGGNAFTFHEALLGLSAAPEVSISGNTVTGTGYLVYDDAVANGTEFTSDNLKLTYATDNVVAATVDTTKGVKDSTKYELSGTVATALHSVDFAAFVQALTDADGVYDGNGITVTLKDSERSYQNNKTAQFFVGATDVNITDPIETVKVSNVNFVFEDDVTDNVYTSGELQVFAKYIEFTGCTFNGVAVSPWGKSNAENAETATFTNCTWKDLFGRYGIHQNRASNLTVTNCRFENCERGIHTNSGTVKSIVITGNTFTGIGAAYGVLCLAEGNGDLSKATLNIAGNVAENQVMLRQLSSAVTYEQVSAILDTTKNTYGTAYVSGSIEPMPPIVAKVGETEYVTIDEAFAALNAENHTLALLNENAWDAATPVYWKAGTQSGYAATLTAALTAAYKADAGAITIVCRPGADVGTMTHGHVADDLTIYGNDAYLSGGECDLEVDTYTFSRATGAQAADGAYLEKDITITAYELDNLGVWGERHTAHTVTVNLTDCDGKALEGKTNVQRVYITGTTGRNDITLTDCDFLTKATAVFSNADGAIKAVNCSFTGGAAPFNINHKANGTQTVAVENCTFTDCGDAGEWKQFAAPVRLVNSGEGTMAAAVTKCTFAGTVGANGDILLGDGRTGQTSNDVTLKVAETAAKIQAQKPGYYGIGTVDATKGATTTTTTAITLETSIEALLPVDPRTLGYATSGKAAALPAAPDMSGAVVNVTAAQAQYVLDGAYGSIDGKTINFTESVDDTLVIGRASKYDGSKTVYRHGSHGGEALSYADFIAYKNQAGWTESCYYERTVENVTFTANTGVIVNFTAEGGAHIYAGTAPVYDYVRDTGTWVDVGSCYFKRAILKNITFKGLTFKAKTNIETSESTTVYDGFTFKDCTFDLGTTAAGNQAIRYYNENNNGNVKNLVVEGCTFKTCYQGVYTHHVKGITVKDCAFDTTGHNAIAIQSQGGEKGACDHGAVVITGNTFKNIGDRIIRFNKVGSGTTITIADNTADGNSGRLDSATGKREIVAAVSLPVNAAEIISSSNNDWGANAVAGGVFADTVKTEKALRRAFFAAPTDGTAVTVTLGADITLETLYAAENFGTEKLDDNAEGDTFNRYKLGVHPTSEAPNSWNPLVTSQTEAERVVYGAYYHLSAIDERIARLVVKAGQKIILDLNGHTIQKNARANHGDWSNVCTDIIGNYGTLEIVDSSTGAKGTIKGIGYISCGGAVLHNYAGATMTVTGVNVDGNAAGMSEGTGQYVISNEGGTLTIDGANVFDTATSASLIMSNGGTVTIKNATLSHPATKLINAKGGVINIESASMASDKYAVFVTGEATVNVNGSLTIEGMGTLKVEGNAATLTKKSGVELSAPAGFTWVENDGVQVLKPFVAKIGETVFSSINAAFAAVNGQSGDDVTIKILKDVTEELMTDYYFTKNVMLATDIEGGVTLNFGFEYGHKQWALLATKGHVLNIEEDVTITNLSQLFSGYSDNDASDVVNVGGVANLQQLWACWDDVVNILPTARIVMGYGDGMIKLRCGTLNVTGKGNNADDKQLSGGYITADNNGDKSLNLKDTYVSTSWLENSGTGTITLDLDNATLELNHESSNGLNLGADATGTINMKNGSLIVTPKLQNVDVINVDATGLTAPVKVVDYTGAGTMTLADYGTVNVAEGCIAYVEDNDLFVRRANYVAQIGETKYETLAEALIAAQSGDTVVLLKDCAGDGITIPSGSNLTVDFGGFTYTVDGTTVGSAGTETQAFQLLQDSTITFRNGTLKSTTAQMLIQNYANLTLDQMVLDGSKLIGSKPYTLSTNNGVTKIKDSTITAAEGGIAFDACCWAPYASNSVELLGASVVNGDIEVSSYNDRIPTLTLTAGTVNGNLVMSNDADKAVVSKSDVVTLAAPADYKWNDEGLLVPKVYVAQVGETKYETLAEAVDAVGNGATITLLKDCAGNGVEVSADKNITIDFAGYTYTVDGATVGSAGTETSGFQLLKGATVTLKGGTLTSTKAKILIQNYANLTLRDMTVTGGAATQYVVSNNCGAMNVLGKTSITATTGNRAFDVCATQHYPDGVTVKIDTTGTITGIIEYDVWDSKPADNKATLEIKNGTFVGSWNVESALAEDAKTNLNVSGGTFSVAVPEDYCATGYYPVANGDGTYGVAKDVKNELVGSVDETTMIKVVVPDSALVKAGYTTGDKTAFVNTTQANGLKVWQNYVMGVDGSVAGNKLLTDYAVGGGAGDGEWITVKTPIAAFNPPTDSGITVKYRLLRTATPDNATSWVAVGELTDTPSFPVNIAGQEGDTFWKIEVVFQGEAANE